MTQKPAEKIYSILSDLASEMGGIGVDFKVEIPKDKSHGDLASNIALKTFQKVAGVVSGTKVHMDAVRANNPMDMAEKMVKILINMPEFNKYFENIEAVKPGFINFYYSKKYLADQVRKIIELGSGFGNLNLGTGKKASVEFVSANPTGPLHIGNARGGPLGDSIANILSKAGYSVTREYLHNDVGGQVERLGEAIYFEIHPDQKTEAYEVQYQGSYIKELAEVIKESLEDEDLSQEEFIEKAGHQAVELMLSEILKDCESMGIKFDKLRKESELRQDVPVVLEKIKSSLKENEGALWFAPNDNFLKDRETVVRKSDGNYTYFASDIVYHSEKMQNSDLVIDILGSNHSGHVPRLQAVIKALGYDTGSFKAILYQYVRLKRGDEVVKMSKRAGSFVTAKEVIDEVGKDAFRFFLLMSRSQTHMDFDLNLAKEKSSENPVFYVQYAYTRISSIFSKIDNSKFKIEDADLLLLSSREEMELIRQLLKFPNLIEDAVDSLEVNVFTTYAIELANLFHKLYENHKVISDDERLTSARLALLRATQITLKNTLDLLGISTPEKM